MATKVITLNTTNEVIAKAILSQQGEAKRWGMAEHAAALRNLACEVIRSNHVVACGMAKAAGASDADKRIASIPEDALAALLKAARPSLLTALLADGMGGNASAFRQKLEKLSMVPKAEAADLEGYD